MLPDLIEIVPLEKPVQALITVPGSKSITNRALILAALADGETILRGALWSEDTQVMVDCLQELGFMVGMAPDPKEECNRTITVYGKGGSVLPGGTEQQPLELFVGNAGTAARFLSAFVCLGKGVYRLHGVPRMHERPQAALFQALRELGYRIDSPNEKLPAMIHGRGLRQGKCTVSIEESSQFASALLLAGRGIWEVEVTGSNAAEQPYVSMTKALLKTFPQGGGTFQVEPDASSGSYFLAVKWLLATCAPAAALSHESVSDQGCLHTNTGGLSLREGSNISVADWPRSGLQIDADFLKLIFNQSPGAPGDHPQTELPQSRVQLRLPSEISREHDLGDSILTAAVLAPLAGHIVRLTNLGRLRVQETERVVALRTELTKCGAEILEEENTLTIHPSSQQLHGAEIETYNDHRMAMCFAVLGLKIPGIRIKNPACVKKTFPDFFQKLASPPPQGLGAIIHDGHTGRKLDLKELFAA